MLCRPAIGWDGPNAVTDTTETSPMTKQAIAQTRAAEARSVYPDTPVYWGYMQVAQLAEVSPGAIRFYYYEDLKRGFPHLMAAPDVMLQRGDEILPGWSPETAKDWVANRRGAGNHTSGAERTGYKGGRTKQVAVAELEPV